jgi:hypothetical protein
MGWLYIYNVYVFELSENFMNLFSLCQFNRRYTRYPPSIVLLNQILKLLSIFSGSVIQEAPRYDSVGILLSCRTASIQHGFLPIKPTHAHMICIIVRLFVYSYKLPQNSAIFRESIHQFKTHWNVIPIIIIYRSYFWGSLKQGGQYMYKRNNEARSCNHCCNGTASVFVAIRHAMRMRPIVICGLPRSTIFFHIIS